MSTSKKDTTQSGENSMFETLNSINVNEKVEKKNGLSYLSWAWAWGELKKRYPDAQYNIERFGENKTPYLHDEQLGYMVFTSITINGLTHEMWLPVMDGANKAMKSYKYTYPTKYGEKTVEEATMFDINKTIMRCLVKNIGMFGLGLYIYAGEDLPESEEHVAMATNEQKNLILSYKDNLDVYKKYKIQKKSDLDKLTVVQASEMLKELANGTTNG